MVCPCVGDQNEYGAGHLPAGFGLSCQLLHLDHRGRKRGPSARRFGTLTGKWQAEHLFALKQSLALFEFYTQQLSECDAEIARQFAAIKPRWEGEHDELSPSDVPAVKPGSKSKNQPQFNVRAEIIRITGVDLVAVDGISASLAQTILSER